MSSHNYNLSFHPHSPTSHSQASTSAHNNRNRRVLRLSHNSQKQTYRNTRKEDEPVVLISFRRGYEAGRSFDLDDDMEFCPGLLTEYDMMSINSASSDRASLSSQSPITSPQLYQASPTLYYNATSGAYPNSYLNCASPSSFKLDPPTRIRNPILIVNPNKVINL
ncbi:hypothetical protein HI914_02701 [Erysiphe necator]|nr:hypothetical protein HI914_02701 [Erysiphe necator]